MISLIGALSVLLSGCVGTGDNRDKAEDTGPDVTDTDSGVETGVETGVDTGVPPFGPALTTDGSWFVDRDGGVVILRGINLSGASKVPPYLPYEEESALDALPGLGFNAVRLLFTWEAYESTDGVQDTAYLDAIEAAARAAWARGMYVVLDFHQDGFSRHLAGGCGDGFPSWAIPPGASLDTPNNTEDCASWALLVATDMDVHDAFSAFYADTYGVRTRYLALLAELAQRFVSVEGVIGYDLINEPWGWESSELSPLYEDAAAAIRAVDPNAILFLEGHAGTNSGVIQTELAEPSFDNFVYAPHFYETLVLTSHAWSGLSYATDQGFQTMTQKASEWNVPLLVGEFGAPAGTWNGLAYVDLQYERLDDNLASSTQWNVTPGWTEAHKDGWNGEDLSILDGSGNLRDNFRVRPQPRRFAGQPKSFQVSSTGVETRWTNDPSLGETVFFLPAVEFFGASNVQITVTDSSMQCVHEGGTKTIRCAGGAAGEVQVEVTPL